MLDMGILVLRLVIGLYVAAHGAQKLFGWFDGPGLRATTGLMSDRMGFRPALLWVTVLAGSELIGGLLMAMGLLGPLGSIAVAGTMVGATVFGHWPNGPWNAKGGYELTVTNLAAAVAVALVGSGRYSVDTWLGLVVPPALSAVFAILVMLGVVAAGLSRRSTGAQREQAGAA